MKINAVYGTTDSYEIRKVYPEITVEELIKSIKHNREKHGKYKYNLYLGGKQDSTMAIIKCYRPGFVRHDCIKLQFTDERNCREFESAIRELFDEENFIPRKFVNYKD